MSSAERYASSLANPRKRYHYNQVKPIQSLPAVRTMSSMPGDLPRYSWCYRGRANSTRSASGETKSRAGRCCRKTISLTRARKIDSRLGADAQFRFENPFAPIRLLHIPILQFVRGDFFDSIGQKQTDAQT